MLFQGGKLNREFENANLPFTSSSGNRRLFACQLIVGLGIDRKEKAFHITVVLRVANDLKKC